MKLIVGLGNPGAKYAMNRHNIGFMALDRIAEDHALGPWKARFQGMLAEGRLGAVRVALLKPQTFMNLSGQSVGEAMRYLKLTPEDVIVVHDELDLAPGKCRIKQGGGHAGHNGLRSIHQHIGDSYGRVRLGIGHPGHKDRVAAYVLSDFAKADQDWLDDLLRGIADGAAALAADDGPRFQNAVAARVTPARNAGQPKPPQAQPKPAPQQSDPAPQQSDPAPQQSDPAPQQSDPAPQQSPSSEPQGLADRLRALASRFR